MRLFRAKTLLLLCVVGAQIVLTDQVTDKTVPCHRHNTQRHPVLVLRANTLGVTGKSFQARWVVNTRMSDRSRVAAAVKAGVKNGRGENGITKSDRKTEAVGMGRVREASQVKSKSEDLIANVARREVTIERAADDIANEKANVQVAKEEGNDPAARLVNHVKGANNVNLAKANLTAALATRVAHQDQDGKSATDAAEAGVEAQETTDESEFVILRTSRMAT